MIKKKKNRNHLKELRLKEMGNRKLKTFWKITKDKENKQAGV